MAQGRERQRQARYLWSRPELLGKDKSSENWYERVGVQGKLGKEDFKKCCCGSYTGRSLVFSGEANED